MVRDLPRVKAITPADMLPDHLRSMFAFTSRAALEERLEGFVRLTLDRLADPTPRPFPPDVPSHQIEKHFTGKMACEGHLLESIIDDLQNHILPYCSNKRSPLYFAQMDIPPADVSIFSGLLIRALAQDPISFSSSRSGTFVEKQVIRWLADLMYPDVPGSGGVMTSGGSQSNYQALLLMRNKAFRKIGIDVNSIGLAAAMDRAKRPGFVFLMSEAAHQSIFSAIRFLGLGDNSVIIVDADPGEQINVASLSAALSEANARGTIIAGVVLTAGTTGSGAVDPLRQAIQVAKHFDVPVHVDAAHGGMLLFSATYRTVLDGISEATSVTFDPHKILGLNQSLGFLAVLDSSHLNELGKVELQYYNPGQEPDLGDLTIDNSRALNSLGAWILLRSLGLSGYEQIVDHLIHLSNLFRQRLDRSRRFSQICGGPMNVIAFQPIGLSSSGPPDRSCALEGIIRGVMRDGKFAISRYCRQDGELFLRAVFVNPGSSVDDVHALADRLIDSVENIAGHLPRIDASAQAFEVSEVERGGGDAQTL